MLKTIGNFFAHVGGGFAHAWDQVVNKNVVPAIGIAAHAVVGFIAGGVWPILQNTITTYFQGGVSIASLNPPALGSMLLSATIGAVVMALVKAAQTSPRQVIKSLAANVTPDQAKNAAAVIDQKILTQLSGMVKPATPAAPPPANPASKVAP